MGWEALTAAAPLAVGTALASGWILRRLPEPLDDPDAADKTPYAALASPRFSAVVGALALGAGLIAFSATPPAAWLAWAGLAGPGALAVAIDGATTWLPRRLTWGMAAVAAAGLALWCLLASDAAPALRAAAGALAVGGFFYLVWRLTGGIGFGDVRLMGVVGAVTAAHSPALAMASVLAGTLLGALWGIAHRLTRGPGPFPYGPALWAGPWIALLAASSL